jgi:hypothetical protein
MSADLSQQAGLMVLTEAGHLHTRLIARRHGWDGMANGMSCNMLRLLILSTMPYDDIQELFVSKRRGELQRRDQLRLALKLWDTMDGASVALHGPMEFWHTNQALYLAATSLEDDGEQHGGLPIAQDSRWYSFSLESMLYFVDKCVLPSWSHTVPEMYELKRKESIDSNHDALEELLKKG